MSISRYVSDIKIVNKDQEVIFNYLSNFENFSKYISEGILGKVSDLVPQIKIVNFSADRDSCSFSFTGFGSAELRIVNRDPFKTIKITSSGSLPVELTLWIQLLTAGEDQTKLRLTLDAGLNMMLKSMIGNRLEEGVNQLAEMLANLPYN